MQGGIPATTRPRTTIIIIAFDSLLVLLPFSLLVLCHQCQSFIIVGNPPSPSRHHHCPLSSLSQSSTTTRAQTSRYPTVMSNLQELERSHGLQSQTNKRLLAVFESSMPDEDEVANKTMTAAATTTPPSKKPCGNNQNQIRSVVDPTKTPIFKYLPSSVRSARSSVNSKQRSVVDTDAGAATGTVVVTPKRTDYVSWDDYFLAVAVLSSKRSKDSSVDDAEGACIVDPKNRIVAVGYSGFPRGCPDTVFPWMEYSNGNNDKDDTDKKDKKETTPFSSIPSSSSPSTSSEWLHTKQPFVCNAVTNAVLNKCSPTVEGCKIYVMKFPSSDSAKMIIQSGIKEVVIVQKNNSSNDSAGCGTVDDGDDGGHLLQSVDAQAASAMLNMANIDVRYHRPAQSSIMLDFQHGGNVGESNNNSTSADGCCHHRHECNDSNLNNISTTKTFTDEEEAAAKILLEEAKYDAAAVVDNGRRKDAISWNDYFMSVAFLTAQRSKDPNTQVGACIVDNDKRIVGLGYNGMPSGLDDDYMPWARENTADPLFNKYLYVCHAEVNAILNKGSADVKGSTLYVALFPCENCAKMIIQAGIRKVVFLKDSYHDTPGCTASRIMLKCAGVELEQYTPSMEQLSIDYY